MAELSYVLKCFVATIILILCLQIKIGGRTIEHLTYDWLNRSKTALYIQTVAAGGALAAQNFYDSAKLKISEFTNGGTNQIENSREQGVRATK